MSDDVRIDNDDRATATLRIPDIRATQSGTVVLELVPADAAVLARILIHYGVLIQQLDPELHPDLATDPADGYDPDVWNQVGYRIRTENAALDFRPEAVLVPFHASHVVAVPRDYLREVGPDEDGGESS